jgi:hypothetical protein
MNTIKVKAYVPVEVEVEADTHKAACMEAAKVLTKWVAGTGIHCKEFDVKVLSSEGKEIVQEIEPQLA